MIISGSIHVVANGIISLLLLLSNVPSYVYTTCSLFSHLSVGIQVASGCFQTLAIVNSASVTTGVLFKLEFLN